MSPTTANLPKVELHVHIDATLTVSLAKQLAKKHQIHLPPQRLGDNDNFICHGFADFIEAYDVIANLIQTAEDYYAVVYDYLKRSAAENVVYTEFILSSQHAEKNNIPFQALIEHVTAAMEQAKQDFDIESRILMVFVRHYPLEDAERTAQLITQHVHPWIVGVTLAGDERHYPPTPFQKAYAIVHEAGLHCTAHAGEVCGPDSIWETLRSLPVTRLGHGVRCIEDNALMAELRDRQIALEVCPTSNIFLHVYADYAQHPLKQIYAAGIPVSLNSDDPTFFATTIGREYQIAQQHLGLQIPDLVTITEQAITHSFADDTTKHHLLDKIKRFHTHCEHEIKAV